MSLRYGNYDYIQSQLLRGPYCGSNLQEDPSVLASWLPANLGGSWVTCSSWLFESLWAFKLPPPSSKMSSGPLRHRVPNSSRPGCYLLPASVFFKRTKKKREKKELWMQTKATQVFRCVSSCSLLNEEVLTSVT